MGRLCHPSLLLLVLLVLVLAAAPVWTFSSPKVVFSKDKRAQVGAAEHQHRGAAAVGAAGASDNGELKGVNGAVAAVGDGVGTAGASDKGEIQESDVDNASADTSALIPLFVEKDLVRPNPPRNGPLIWSIPCFSTAICLIVDEKKQYHAVLDRTPPLGKRLSQYGVVDSELDVIEDTLLGTRFSLKDGSVRGGKWCPGGGSANIITLLRARRVLRKASGRDTKGRIRSLVARRLARIPKDVEVLKRASKTNDPVNEEEAHRSDESAGEERQAQELQEGGGMEGLAVFPVVITEGGLLCLRVDFSSRAWRKLMLPPKLG